MNGESIQPGYIETGNLNYLPPTFKRKYAKFILKENDIVIGLNRPIIGGKLKIAMIPSFLENSLLYQRAGKIILKKETSVEFSYILISKYVFEFVKFHSVGSDQPFISTTKLQQSELNLPSSNGEKNDIGNLISHIMRLIAANEQAPKLVIKIVKNSLTNSLLFN